MTIRPVIALEFNELSPVLMEKFISEGKLPNFAKLKAQSVTAITDAEESGKELEPWIQWVTVHTGLSYAQHKVFDLGDGHKLNAPRLWDMVSDSGKKVWICGSMNAAIQGGRINGQVLPDPWSTGIEPYPQTEFAPFFHLVKQYVQEYSRDKVPLGVADYARFGWFMLTHGLSFKTVWMTVKQLAGERGGKSKWKRAFILDRLQFDVFRHYWKSQKPAYATFFLNSTAHMQHYYWRNMEPEKFQIQATAQEQAEYARAIEEAYIRMDDIVGETLAMAPEAAIVFITALSQHALSKYDESGGKQVFRPHNDAALLKFAGVTAKYQYAPVMAEEFHLYFDNELAAADAEKKLAALRLDGQPVMRVRRTENEIFAGCDIFTPPAAEAHITSTLSNRSAEFYELFYRIHGMKSGSHHPDGMLWIRHAEMAPRTVAERIPLRQVAPTLAQLLEIPGYAQRFESPAFTEQKAVA
jgi:hypothetical protein